MLIHAIARYALQGVAEGMAKIQNFPQAGFAFIAADHLRFDFRASWNDIRERGRVTADDSVHVHLKISKKLGIEDHAVLDYFG